VAVKVAAEIRTDPTAKLVLMMVAYRAGADGRAWPSMATIAADTGLRERAVRHAVHRLAKEGHLEVIHRPGKSSVLRHQMPDTPPLRCRAPLPSDAAHPSPLRGGELVKELVKERGGVRANGQTGPHTGHFSPGSGWINDWKATP
jgi:hypothetical protein